MGSSFFGWFERSSLWCPGRKPWVTKRCVWSSVWREPKTTENDFAGMRGEGGGVLPRGAGASGALVIVLEASGCGRRANGWCSMEFQFKEWVEPGNPIFVWARSTCCAVMPAQDVTPLKITLPLELTQPTTATPSHQQVDKGNSAQSTWETR